MTYEQAEDIAMELRDLFRGYHYDINVYTNCKGYSSKWFVAVGHEAPTEDQGFWLHIDTVKGWQALRPCLRRRPGLVEKAS